MVKKIYSVLFVLFFITSVQSVSAQEVCPSGNECSWIGTTDVTQFGVKPSASAQGFWNDQVTKDTLCQLSGYERNPGFDWAVRQGKWNKCNAEYHVDWRGVWDSHKCGGDSYVTAVYCTRNIPAPAEPTLSFSANPTAVTPFGKTTLTWSAQNVTSCTASGDWSGSKGFSGSEETSMLVFGDKTFTLTCSGSGGSVSKDVNVSLYVVPSAPTISWTSAPATVSSGAGYTISAKGEDADGNLVSVVIKKAGASFASSGAGDGMSSTASAQSVDAGPATITYTAQATDGTNRVSSEIEHTVSVTGITMVGGTAVTTTGDAVTIVPVSASVSVSPSCVAPGDTISVSGSASGGLLNGVSTITSNELQKDSNKDGVFGVIASRSDAGNTSANVSVPAGETSNRYDFKTRVASNGSFVESSVMSVTIDPSCGQPSTLCSVFPFLCNSVTPPATPVSNSVSLSVNPSCALPGSTVSFSSTAGGSITSHIIEKDSNQDGVYGTLASLSSGPGTKTHSDSFSEGTYDFRAVINGSVYSSPARIQVSPSCQPSQPPAVVGGGFPGFGGGFGGSGGSGGSIVTPPPIVRSFTLTASPSSVKVKSVAGYSGSVEQTIDISVNPVNFNSPVSIEATDIPSDLKPEFSFNNGPFSENVIAPATLNSGGLQYMPVKIRFAGKVPSGSFTIGFRGTGGNLSQTTYVTFDSRPLIPGYIEI